MELYPIQCSAWTEWMVKSPGAILKPKRFLANTHRKISVVPKRKYPKAMEQEKASTLSHNACNAMSFQTLIRKNTMGKREKPRTVMANRCRKMIQSWKRTA